MSVRIRARERERATMTDATTHAVSRRAFLAGGAGVVGLAALGGIGVLVPGMAEAKKGGGGGGGGATANPLFIPPTVAVSSGAAYALYAETTTLQLGGDRTSPGIGYRSPQSSPTSALGTMPGPTFVTQLGDDVDITLHNQLHEDTTVHWHGMLVPTSEDGQPHEHVHMHASRQYRFDVINKQRPAFNWYHPHPHGHVSPQVAMGLAGGFVVADPTETSRLGLPVGGAYDVPLVIRDVQFDSRGDMQYKPNSNGYLGSVPLVNGTLNPYLTVRPALYRLRILNGAPARVFRLARADGASLVLVGNDGGLLGTAPVALPEIELGPAERVELVVDLRTAPAGSRVVLRCLAAGWDLLELRVDGDPVANGGVWSPTRQLSSIAALTRNQVDREFSFDGMSRINGLVYDMHRIDFQVPFDTVERWRFTTGGNAPHPVHIHGGHFQVVRRVGRGGRNRVLPWETGWKDTVLLNKGEEVEVLVRFDAFKGRYLMHCHQLEHEDSGMMMNFEVT
jgi:blue copper oxidase